MRAAERLLARGGDSWIGLAAVASIITFFRDPSRNPVHLLVAPFDTWWAIAYAVGGLLLLASIGWKQPLANVEAAGWALLIVGALIQMLVFIWLAVPFTVSTVVVLGFLCVIGAYRIRAILRAPPVSQ